MLINEASLVDHSKDIIFSTNKIAFFLKEALYFAMQWHYF